MKISFQLILFFTPVVQPAQKNSFQPFKPACCYSLWRLFSRKSLNEFRAGNTIVQKGFLQRIKLRNRKAGRNGKPVIPTGRIEGFGLVFPVFCLPEADGTFFKGTGFIHCCSPVERSNLPHPPADRTGSFLRIKGKVGGCELFHFLPTLPAILVNRKFLSRVAGTESGNHLFPAVRSRNRFSAVGAGPHAQFFIEHPQSGIEIRHRAHCGTGAAVLVSLGDHDGGGSVFHALHRRLCDSLEGHGLQILPLAFHIQDVD